MTARSYTTAVELERRRLRKIFGAALAGVVLTPALLYACSSSSSSPEAGGLDASMPDAMAAPDSVVFPESSFSLDAQFVDRYEEWCEAGPPFPIAHDSTNCDLVEYSPCGLPAGASPSGGTGIYASFCVKICTFDAGIVGCDSFDPGSFAGDSGYIFFDGGAQWTSVDAGDGGDDAGDGSTPTGTLVPALITCSLCNNGGRRPEGYRPRRAHGGGVVADYFGLMADLEAASVTAFNRLRDELRAHGAGRSLISEAARAARDEVRHARTMARLARRYGAPLSPPGAVARLPVRGLEAIATENAVEGCVRETYGALVATWQARAARDPSVARAMRRIARDETRHAALAWAVARWAEHGLSVSARRRVDEARVAARASLRAEVARAPSAALVHAAGVPSAPHAAALFARASNAFV